MLYYKFESWEEMMAEIVEADFSHIWSLVVGCWGQYHYYQCTLYSVLCSIIFVSQVSFILHHPAIDDRKKCRNHRNILLRWHCDIVTSSQLTIVHHGSFPIHSIISIRCFWNLWDCYMKCCWVLDPAPASLLRMFSTAKDILQPDHSNTRCVLTAAPALLPCFSLCDLTRLGCHCTTSTDRPL